MEYLVQSRTDSVAMLDGWSRPAVNRLLEPPSQRSSTDMELDEDTGPISRVRVNTAGVSQSSPGRGRVKAENLSTGNRRVHLDRAWFYSGPFARK